VGFLLQPIPEKEGEFEIIESYFKGLTTQEGVLLGIGDDAAILDIYTASNKKLVVATDTLVEKVHFPGDTSAYNIAQRALCVNLSDMAAMGATPRWFTLALTLPSEYASSAWLKDFSAGLAEVAKDYNCALIGGDTTSGPLTVSITMLGEVTSELALKRSGAKVGDAIYVTGHLADGGAGLTVVTNSHNSENTTPHLRDRLHQRFYRPQPKVSEGLYLAAIASSCIDISDGLIADVGHLCKSSGVSADVSPSLLPIHTDVKSAFPDDYLTWALYGGDDYQLCFTLPNKKVAKLTSWIAEGRLEATRIGEIIACKDSGPEVLLDGAPINKLQKGFDHFGC
tara:strand:+ start:10120 stop:11136 length:1017 start_codon:yes stop_codon:yes gene_type:complete